MSKPPKGGGGGKTPPPASPPGRRGNAGAKPADTRPDTRRPNK